MTKYGKLLKFFSLIKLKNWSKEESKGCSKTSQKSQEEILRNEQFVSLKNNSVAEVLFSIDYNLKKNEKSKKATNNFNFETT